jgi:hypothetical protein
MHPDERRAPMPEPHDETATLTDEDIETVRTGGLATEARASDDADDSADTTDTGDDSGDDSGDVSDTTDTGDDSGDDGAAAA